MNLDRNERFEVRLRQAESFKKLWAKLEWLRNLKAREHWDTEHLSSGDLMDAGSQSARGNLMY